MGIISIEQTERLYWLGRYSERTYTILRLYAKSYDMLLESLSGGYKEFCTRLDIPDIYENKEDFLRRYAFDKEDSDSIISNLSRAYDNAIVLREEIGSEALSYIQLAIYEISRAETSDAPLIEIQTILDDLLAFWGIVDDSIDSENVRNIIKTGKRVERLDLYARLKFDREHLLRECRRLSGRITRTGMKYNQLALEKLEALITAPNLDYFQIVSEAEKILEV